MRKRPPVVIVEHQGRRLRLPPHPTDICPAKRRYDTEIAARMGGQSALTVPGRARGRVLWPYFCGRCAGWHLTNTVQPSPAITAIQLWEGTDGVPPDTPLPSPIRRIRSHA